ncbi:hypothetical protein [Streptomyces chiangmaiensis]|uniref:hypothetical protein n=1 Tax=Streptomyces chiangmaiensis TaxID=766497 RepID=UPI0031E51429
MGVTRRHRTAYGRKAHGGGGDLVTRRSGELTQVVRVGDELAAPSAECLTRLSDPMNPVDVAVELIRCRLDGVACIPQDLAGGFEILGIRLPDQVDHLVEREVALVEVCPSGDGLSERGSFNGGANDAVEEPSLWTVLYASDEVRYGVLRGDTGQVRAVLLIGHRQYPAPVCEPLVCRLSLFTSSVSLI